jgi:nucleotide-binding universal stress UspA family protein
MKNTALAELIPTASTAARRMTMSRQAPPQSVVRPSSIKRILAPTDLSELSEAGVRYALTAARELGAAVTVFYVVTRKSIVGLDRTRDEREFLASRFYSIVEAYEMLLKKFVEQRFGDMIRSVKVDFRVEVGTPERRIVRTAKSQGADLIVIATRGMSGLRRVILGSVTEEVIRNAPCPVVAVPSTFATPPRGGKRDRSASLSEPTAPGGALIRT